jgi:hypothetical protein
MLVLGSENCEYYLYSSQENHHRAFFKFAGIEILIIGVYYNPDLD